MKITNASHLDHGLTPEHVELVMARFGAKTAFFIETMMLPPHFSPLKCELHGPMMGDPPVSRGRRGADFEKERDS